MQDLTDKVVVISGGSSGFGRAMAAGFHAAGSKVVITGTNEVRLKMAQDEIGQLDALQSDVTSPEDWEKLYKFVDEKYGRIDVLVNNAGSGVSVKEITDQSVADIDYIIKLNLNSAAYATRLFGGMMKKQASGTIINISSACATEAWPNFSIYAAAKAGLVALSKGCYTELRPYNIRVTAVIPGAGRTNFSENAGLPEPDSPFKLEPADMAEAVLHICRMPPHIFIEEYRIWGMDQEVIPL